MSATDIFMAAPLRGEQVASLLLRRVIGADGAVKAMHAAMKERAAVPHTTHGQRKIFLRFPAKLPPFKPPIPSIGASTATARPWAEGKGKGRGALGVPGKWSRPAPSAEIL